MHIFKTCMKVNKNRVVDPSVRVPVPLEVPIVAIHQNQRQVNRIYPNKDTIFLPREGEGEEEEDEEDEENKYKEEKKDKDEKKDECIIM